MSWINEAVFYHIYPLGLFGAPRRNDFSHPPIHRLAGLIPWLDHMKGLGANALYIGPLFESSAHGYDTADYYHIDRRLGDDNLFRWLSGEIRGRAIRLVLDAVFNHVGRDFWAFRDVQALGAESPYAGWFYLDFSRQSLAGDPFWYEGWAGHYDLVKLNLGHPGVREHLFGAVTNWIEAYDIDGLRLDAADVMDRDFLSALAWHCKQIKPDFWLVGEIVHGDYSELANPQRLDSATNYECYKGLYSSLVDRNYFEIAYALNRQFGEHGQYRGLQLYNFADNHDVNRVASSLKEPAHLYPLYLLLMTMPGVPSIYYGSEWGLPGARSETSDSALRPALDLDHLWQEAPEPDLRPAIERMIRVRQQSQALRLGSYQQVHVASEQFAFSRRCDQEEVIVALNAADEPAALRLHGLGGRELIDLLNPGRSFPIEGGKAEIELDPTWGSVFRVA